MAAWHFGQVIGKRQSLHSMNCLVWKCDRITSQFRRLCRTAQFLTSWRHAAVRRERQHVKIGIEDEISGKPTTLSAALIRSDDRGETPRPPAAIFLRSEGIRRDVAFELPLMGAMLTPDVDQHHAGAMRLHPERESAVFEALGACECGRPAGVCHPEYVGR